MAKLEHIFSRIQLVYRRSQTATKIIVILAIVLSIGALITLRLTTRDLQAQTKALQSQAADLTAANEELEKDIGNLGSVQSVIDIAEDELGLVQPGTVVFQPESD